MSRISMARFVSSNLKSPTSARPIFNKVQNHVISLPKKPIQTKGCINDFNSNHGRIAEVLYSVCSGARLHALGKPSELGKQFKPIP
ncbi:hypothetical protein VNO77_22541 [Canavalia gladiata]|uniref:Uncharacterized protein n=1 Tax=Canavalia gladiata TaxID=3824 RepID=A0AAN9L2T0_CANGL